MRQAAVGDELEVVLHHCRVHAQYAAWHGVTRVFDFQLGALQDHLRSFFLHFSVPQVRVFDLDLVDHVDAEVQVHGFVAQDVLELLGNTGHFVATAHRQDLGEAAVEEDAFQNAVVGDQVAQQFLVGFDSTGLELRIRDRAGVFQAPGGFFGNRRDLVVHVEDLAFIHGQRFDAVLVGVGVDRLFEGLAQDVLAALRVGDQAVNSQYQVVGDQGVGSREEAQVAHHDAAFVVGQAFRVFPEGDVGGHVDFLRHPVVCATVQVFLPRPVVLERHELVEVGAAVDHHLFVNRNTGGSAFEFGQAFSDVEVVQRGLGANDRSRVGSRDCTGFLGSYAASCVEAVHVGFGCVACVGAFNSDFAFVFFVEFVPAQHDVSSPA